MITYTNVALIIIALEILFIWYMIWDNTNWQKKAVKLKPKPKPKYKLKKGQKVSFGDINPFEEE